MIESNGEYYPEKNLKSSYKIPRKSPNTQNPPEMPNNHEIQTPLMDSYYNYGYDPNGAYYQNYQYFCQYSNQTGQVPFNNEETNLQRGVKRPLESNIAPLKQSICEALSGIGEKPKNCRQNIFQQTVPDLLDESLPKDLKQLFQPLFCKLCSAQLSSNQTAKLHYKSRNHEKKIRKWLVDWSERTGEPLPKRASTNNADKKTKDAEKNPTWFHCDVCDLELTGQMHAESHYMGRNHQKALLGHKAPAGQGYYKDGKWVRVKNSKSSNTYDFEKGEDNFGTDFKKPAEETEGPMPKRKKESQPIAKFHCEVCDINTTCQEQLEGHYQGQKHAKKLKQFGMGSSAELKDLGVPTVNVATCHPNPLDLEFNLSVYRTPSGDYYCPNCNLTVSAEPQFLQHMRSKGHAKKVLQKKT